LTCWQVIFYISECTLCQLREFTIVQGHLCHVNKPIRMSHSSSQKNGQLRKCFISMEEFTAAFAAAHHKVAHPSHNRCWKRLSRAYFCRGLHPVVGHIIDLCETCVLHRKLPSRAPLIPILTSHRLELVSTLSHPLQL
jgi:hypothetical protein